MVDYMAETDYAVPTGDFIAEWLEDHHMRPSELADRMGVSRKHVSRLLSGVPLTADIATRLELVTGVSAKRWLALETQYRADLARLALEAELTEAAELLQELPLTELRRGGFVTATRRKPGQVLRECMSFFRVGDLDALRQVVCPPAAVAFRQTSTHQIKWGAVATWLRLGEIAAEEVDAKEYDRAGLVRLLPELRSLSASPPQHFGQMLVRNLASVGVSLVYVPEVAGARAYGATHWNKDRPIVQLSLRGSDDGHFWFTMFHELGHVLHHPHNKVFVRPVEDGDASGNPEAENEADVFASDLLIPPRDAEHLASLRSQAAVVEFANRIGVAPGVVLGRLHHDGYWPYKNGQRLYRRLRLVETDTSN